jgi:hypothetical protein
VITFAGAPYRQITLNGGGGDDEFYTSSQDSISKESPVLTTILGGALALMNCRQPTRSTR